MAVSSDRRPEVATLVLHWWEESQHVADDPEPQTFVLEPARPAHRL